MAGEPLPVHEAVARFRAEVGAAVGRGRRAAAEAREGSAGFRGRTRELTEQVRQRSVTPSRDELTSAPAREQATRFRTAARLPVDDLPDGEQLLAPPAPNPQEQKQMPAADPRRSRMQPRPYTDDDEDFSQERILY